MEAVVTDGDIQQWDSLVFRIARPYVHAMWPLEDLVQEGRRGVLKALRTYQEGYKTKLMTWIYIVVRGAIRHAIRDGHILHSRDGAVGVDYLEDLKIPEGSCSDESIVDNAAAQAILNKLTQPEQELIQMRCTKQMSFPEIGRALGISAPAASRRFHRAIVHARKQAGADACDTTRMS